MHWSIVVLTSLLPAAAGALEFDFDLERVEKIAPRHYLAYRTAGELAIDGRLDEPSWQRAAWTEFFVDIEGDSRPVPRFKTRAKMLWDDEYFYVAADMEEPHVWATLEERDARIYHDNDFEVFIDPNGDTHEYYEFEINALGTPWDLFLVRSYRDGNGPYLSSWDIHGLQSAVTVWGTLNDPGDEDQGWSVELAFPWKVLKEASSKEWPAPPRNGDTWRVNFSRVQHQVDIGEESYSKVAGDEDNWVWSPQGLVNMHYPEMWGFVQFSDAVVGRGEAVFAPLPEEEAKKVLRGIYYRQRAFRKEHGRFTASLDSLGMEYRNLSNFLWPPQLQVTDHLFEAWLEEVVDLHGDGEIDCWHIRQDSRSWKGGK